MSGFPRWARGVLKAGDAKKIEAAVKAAEARCGAEFVPVLVRSSSGVGHVGLSVGLLLLFGFYFLLYYRPLAYADLAWKPWFYPLAVAVIAGALGWFFSNFSMVQRLFTPRHDRERAVDRRARLEFYKHHVEATKTGNGILLFVSLMERKAVVLCGKTIAAKVPRERWAEVVRVMSQGARSGQLGDGLAEAIAKSAELVRPYLRTKSRKNELSDRLIVKE